MTNILLIYQQDVCSAYASI